MLLQGIFTFSMVKYQPARYGTEYTYPPWADAVGWLLVAMSVLMIPAFAVVQYFRFKRDCKEVGKARKLSSLRDFSLLACSPTGHSTCASRDYFPAASISRSSSAAATHLAHLRAR